MKNASAILAVENLSVRFGDRAAVRNVSFEVKPGEIFVLMGRSGSGKSTLLRCINGLQKPSGGSVTLSHKGENVDISRCALKQARHLRRFRMSMVFQQFALFPWRNAIDNVAFGLELQRASARERTQKAKHYLEMVGLLEDGLRYPHELSGGMQQRVGIARALATGADILLMDEPFSALDPVNRKQLQNEVKRLQAELGKTILFVTHDVEEASTLAHRIAVMQNGELLQCASPAEIKAHPTSEEISHLFA